MMHGSTNIKSCNTFYSVSGLVLALRTLGPAVGFALGFGCLSLYIDPTVTPVITRRDPRWLGAWWLGNTYWQTRSKQQHKHKYLA